MAFDFYLDLILNHFVHQKLLVFVLFFFVTTLPFKVCIETRLLSSIPSSTDRSCERIVSFWGTLFEPSQQHSRKISVENDFELMQWYQKVFCRPNCPTEDHCFFLKEVNVQLSFFRRHRVSRYFGPLHMQQLEGPFFRYRSFLLAHVARSHSSLDNLREVGGTH